MPRFYLENGGLDRDTAEVTLLGEDARHISLSLRMRVGDEITVSDGAGQDYLCRLTALLPDRVSAEVLSPLPRRGELPFPIHLYMAYPKGDTLEFIIEKAVELGAFSVTPFLSSRCVRRPAAEKTARLSERYRKIARGAAGQCGRSVLPRVGDPLDLQGMLKEAAKAELALFCYEGEGTLPLPGVLRDIPAPASVAVIIGSEGGFSEEEAAAARAAGCIPVGLGERILRCETAPLAALSFLLYRYGFGKI